MLKWQRNYYVGEGINNPEKIYKKVNAGKLVPGIYLLTLSETPGNLVEMLPASVLAQKAARAVCPPIIGMAKGKDSAIALTAEILEEMYKKTGTFRLEEYMENR